ncbi:MAG: sigma factor-like helix-turn-helix DNA-binding protein [Oscillospiraceae bacterium]|nr:sigma factor-like helix-turn-helix DNA-binding protein [Oscillospiraceae bacterium]
MRHRLISITEKNQHLITYSDFDSYETNDRDISKMKKILHKAIECELTDKQKYCVCQYYYNGRSMKSIASELQVNPSTVTRHIQNARRRLKRVAQYY